MLTLSPFDWVNENILRKDFNGQSIIWASFSRLKIRYVLRKGQVTDWNWICRWRGGLVAFCHAETSYSCDEGRAASLNFVTCHTEVHLRGKKHGKTAIARPISYAINTQLVSSWRLKPSITWPVLLYTFLAATGKFNLRWQLGILIRAHLCLYAKYILSPADGERTRQLGDFSDLADGLHDRIKPIRAIVCTRKDWLRSMFSMVQGSLEK